MPEEKRGLPPVKELLEMLHGVKLHEPTEEELEKTGQVMEEAARRMKANGARRSGPKDI